jgi:hypothetical protein
MRSIGLEEKITLLIDKTKRASLTVKELLHILSGKGRFLIIILLSLPFCQPVQIPGFSTPFGIAIAFFGIRSAFGKKIWLPERLLTKKISSKKLQRIAQKGLWLLKKCEKFLHPRLPFLTRYPAMKVANGLLIALMGIFLALPLPVPFSNIASAWSLLLLSLGLLEDDGVFMILGYIASFSTILFFLLIALSWKLFF